MARPSPQEGRRSWPWTQAHLISRSPSPGPAAPPGSGHGGVLCLRVQVPWWISFCSHAARPALGTPVVYLAWPLVVSGGTLRWVPQCAPLGAQPREPQAHAAGDDTHVMGPSAQPARPRGTGPGLGARGSHKCSTHVEMEAQRGAMTCPRTHSETGLNPLMPSRCSSRGKVRWRAGHVGPTWFQPLSRDTAATCGAPAAALSR